MNERRVVVTGIGAVSCLGNSFPETWNAMVAGKSGIGRFSGTGSDGISFCAGEVKGLTLQDITPKEERRTTRYARLAVAAADEAMRSAGLARDPEVRSGDPFRFGALITSSVGGVIDYEQNLDILNRRGPNGVLPLLIPKFLVNGASGTIAIRHGLRGPNFSPTSACASGSHALGEAMWIIRRGDADLMLAGGTEACLTPLMLSGFYALTALSCNPDPAKACRPFDRDRDGFVLAEGAALLVLEEAQHARKRGAEILAELTGYGATCDATHITAPDPEALGSIRAMRSALASAGCPKESIGCISAHGTGTRLNDRCEAKAIREVFGDHADKIKVSAIKSMLGHPLAASSSFSAAAAVQTLRTGIVPPTINYETPDPECDLDVTPNHAAEIDTEAVMTNSLGFGGHNAALVFRRWKG